ncbi:MAG: 3-deoxy-D-manno-octulosonic acid kinase [Kangiellaceae bacterium]|nr:3-deoxy-D-manno-octulosonic acid kinase [Kangiellaceae bacterium]
MKIQQIDNRRTLVTTKKYRKIVESSWFDHEKLAEQGDIIGQSVGRSTTYFFAKEGKEFVLRKYYRGGLLGNWLEDRYLFSSLKNTRAYQEHKILRKMRKLKLPVPKPVAFMIERYGLVYRASIIIRLVKNTQDLFHLLRQRALSNEEWQAVGQMIRQFHSHGVYHSDLNIHNILINKKGKLWLIDFDKGKFVEPGAISLQSNLERLLRSLRKEKNKYPDFHWRESDWALLLQGYLIQDRHI